MTTPMDVHAQYLAKHGFMKWLLRECVRANPLYVISAALLAYGVYLMESEVDDHIGQMAGKMIAFSLLNIYELAVLVVATVILRLRQPVGSGGQDLHGLMLVMLLFLGGSFLAQDEIIAAMPEYGIFLVITGLLLAAIKLAWYGRLPGVLLPRKFQVVLLGMLAGHSVAPLWNGAGINKTFGILIAQGLSWMLGWLTLAPMFLLVWKVEAQAAAGRRRKRLELGEVQSRYLAACQEAQERGGPVPDFNKPEPEPLVDFLATRFFGHVALAMTATLGLLHLIGSDWVFDRPADYCRSFPALTLLLASVLAFIWHYRRKLGFLGWAGFSAPVMVLNVLWLRYTEVWNVPMAWTWTLLLHPLVQIALALIVFYAGLSWATGRKRVLLGLLGLFIAPIGWAFGQLRLALPYFRAFMFVFIGFVILMAGMVMSLLRQRILRFFESHA